MLRIGVRRFVVSPSVAASLERIRGGSAHDLSSEDERIAERVLAIVDRAQAPAAILWRRTLIPEWATVRLARALEGLFTRGAVLAVSATVSGLLWALVLSRPAPFTAGVAGAPAVFAAGFLLIMMLHEIGHVAATHASGARPGEIGCGFYLIFPVLYANVDEAWTLPRHQRVQVSAGGVYFQLVAAVPLLVLALAEGSAVWTSLLVANAVAAVHMLNPLLRLDGYWLLSDLSGVENLRTRAVRIWHATVRGQRYPGVEGRSRFFVLAYGVAASAFMLLIVVLLARRSMDLAGSVHLDAALDPRALFSTVGLGGRVLWLAELALVGAAWSWIALRLLRTWRALTGGEAFEPVVSPPGNVALASRELRR